MLGNLARHLPAVLLVGIATAVLALTVRPTSVEPAWAIVGGRLVALALLAAGGSLWFAGRPIGAVAATLAGLSWAGVIWSIERVNGADALVAAGMLLAPLLVPMLILLVIGLPDLWRIPRRAAPVLAAGALLIAVTGVGRALVYEPILDLDCGLFCGHSPVVVVANLGLAAWLGAVTASTTVVVCGSMAVGILAARSGRASGRRDLSQRLLAAAAMLALGATALAGIVPGASGLASDDLVRLVAVRAAACVAIAGAALLVAAERLSVGRNLARIARLLAGGNERPTAEALLRDAVGDPNLSVGYWTDERGYLGSDGQPIDAAAPGRQRTELTSRGRPIAVVLHDTRALPADLVEANIGPEARLALQNESLELELGRRLEQLRASRRRVVDAGDAARRQLERDLHDGAQQLLLALSFEVRRGERHAVENGDVTSAALFAEARGVAGRILDQLRVLAHGIHPTILTNAGLEPALASYASSLASPPRLDVALKRRLSPASEASVYAIVTALVAAAPEGAGMTCSIREEDDTIRILVGGRVTVPDHVLDRLGAAGGWSAPGESGPELVLPCG